MGFLSWIKGDKPAAAPARPVEEPLPDEGDDLSVFARAIESRNGAARVDASRGLLERWRNGDAQAAELMVGKLDALLEDGEPMVKQAALAGVRLLRKPENLEKHASAVLGLLADRAAPVRTAAVWAAIKLPGDTARTQVRALLQSTDEPLRFDAATALAEVKDAAALGGLTAALNQGYRRQEALSALMSLGDAAALPALAELWDQGDEAEQTGDFDRTLLAAALARFGDQRGKRHLALRAAEGGDDRPVAVEWAGRLGVSEAIPALDALADEEGELSRGAALRALGRLKAPGAEERLLAVVNDAELADDLRMDAAEGLAELGTAPALAALSTLAALKDAVAEVCQGLLGELAALEAQQAAAAPETPVAD